MHLFALWLIYPITTLLIMADSKSQYAVLQTNIQALTLGYLFAVLFGYLAIERVMNDLHKKFRFTSAFVPGSEKLPKLVGLIERVLYVASFEIRVPAFIGFWLALKAAGQWKSWSNETEGRARFNLFLIGSGLSVVYGVGAAFMLQCAGSHAFYILPLCILIGTEMFRWVINKWLQDVPKDAQSQNEVGAPRGEGF